MPVSPSRSFVALHLAMNSADHTASGKDDGVGSDHPPAQYASLDSAGTLLRYTCSPRPAPTRTRFRSSSLEATLAVLPLAGAIDPTRRPTSHVDFVPGQPSQKPWPAFHSALK